MAMLELSAPFNWCDRQCPRCVLEAECPVAEQSRGHDGEDLMAAVTASLKESVELLEAIAAEEGISLDELPEPPPPPLESTLLQRVAADYCRAIRASHPGRALLLQMKIARIASHTRFDDGGSWEMDAVPNLLLIERILDELQTPVSQRTLRGLLAPLISPIPASVRAAIDALIAAGRAPSPFVTSPGGSRAASA
jgi:hypothetical protein